MDALVAMVVGVVDTTLLDVDPTLLLYDDFTTSRPFTIANLGGGTLDWQMSADQTWIQIGPPLTGTGSKTVSVHVDLAQVSGPQVRTGHVTVSSNGGVEMVEIRYRPSSGGGEAGTISLYSDLGLTSCEIDDNAGVVYVYVVHEYHPGASAIQFSAPVPSCWTGAVWLADTIQFPLTIGNTQDGIAVSYGGCQAGRVHIASMLISTGGTGGECCEYLVLPDPVAPSGQIEGVDCAVSGTFPNSKSAVVNVNPSCPCGDLVSVETKTWGAVKALYLPDEAERR
jgi:hypothetical protein